jgi:hypothetical protein
MTTTTTPTYSAFNHFAPKHRDGFDAARDGDYDFRAWVRYDLDGISTGALFPPAQLVTTDSKYDFNRHLTSYIDSLKGIGASVKSVDVYQGGNTAPLYSFNL